MGLTLSSHAGVCCPRKNGALCVSKSFVLPVQLFLRWPISAIVVALSWPHVEQFLPSQISSRHSKQCGDIMVWQFLLRRDEEMEGWATGVNKIPPLQQVPRDTECPWNRQHLTFARHLQALPCGFQSNYFAFPISIHSSTSVNSRSPTLNFSQPCICNHWKSLIKTHIVLSPKPFLRRQLSLRWKNAASILTTTDRFSHVRFLPAHTEAWELNSVFMQVNEHLEQHS